MTDHTHKKEREVITERFKKLINYCKITFLNGKRTRNYNDIYDDLPLINLSRQIYIYLFDLTTSDGKIHEFPPNTELCINIGYCQKNAPNIFPELIFRRFPSTRVFPTPF